MSHRTTGELEAAISNAMIQFEVEYMGRGPRDVKTYIFDDSVFVKMHGILSKAERELISQPDCGTGVELIKKVRCRLIENSKPHLFKIVKDILGVEVKHLHTDLSTTNGERVIIFTMAKKIRDYKREESHKEKKNDKLRRVK